MKVLLTGGAGFIGSHICDRYIKLGHQVIVVDNLLTGKKENLNQEAQFINADIQDRQAISDIFHKYQPDILSHHAAQLDVRRSVADPVFDANINIIGLLNLLESAKNNNLKKVIFASSGGAVYGDAGTLPTPEDYPDLKPLSPYGIAKLTSEHYLYYYYTAHNIPYIALRYANVYGPRQDPFGEAGVIAIFTQKLLKNEEAVINGDGKQTRDYVYIGDIVEANTSALTSSYTGSLNVGTGKETTVNEIFSLVNKLTGKNMPEKHAPQKIGEQRRSVLDNSKIKKELNWSPQMDLENGLKATVEYFRNKNE